MKAHKSGENAESRTIRQYGFRAEGIWIGARIGQFDRVWLQRVNLI